MFEGTNKKTKWARSLGWVWVINYRNEKVHNYLQFKKQQQQQKYKQ